MSSQIFTALARTRRVRLTFARLGVAWGAFERQLLYDAGAEAVLETPAELLSYLRYPQKV